MVYSEYAKVKNVLIVDTKYGRRKVCNVTTDRGEEAIWANDLNAFSNIKPGQTINVIRGAKGGLTILENTPTMSATSTDVGSRSEVSNGNSNIQMNRPSSQQEGYYYTHSNNRSNGSTTYSQRASNASNTPVNYEEAIEDLDLPHPLSDQDKVRLKKLIVERTKLLNACIQAVRREMPDVKDERSLRSLAVTIFININPYLPK